MLTTSWSTQSSVLLSKQLHVVEVCTVDSQNNILFKVVFCNFATSTEAPMVPDTTGSRGQLWRRMREETLRRSEECIVN